MSIHITDQCRHCGQKVEQGEDLFSMWFHSGRHHDETSRKCDPSDPHSTLALPKIEIRKREES